MSSVRFSMSNYIFYLLNIKISKQIQIITNNLTDTAVKRIY